MIFSLTRRVTSSGFSPCRISTTPPTASLPSFSSTLRRKAGPTCTAPSMPTLIGVPMPRRDDDRIANVIEVLDPADRADQVLGVSLVDDPAADRRVGPGDRRIHFAQADAVGPELARGRDRSDISRRTADAGDLGHARHAGELVADEPVLDRPQLTQGPARRPRPCTRRSGRPRWYQGRGKASRPAAETSRRSRASRARARGRSR